MENKFYCIGDISFKLGTSIMLLATNDLANNEDLRRRAETVAEDLQRLITTASVPIFGIDTHGCISEWNMKVAHMTGLPEAKVLGIPLLNLIGAAASSKADAMIVRALAGEEPGTLEASLDPSSLPQAEGLKTKRAMLVMSAAPRKDKTGAVKGVTFVGYDLTEVAAFREAEERKVRFMAVVSHELRSPLHGIIGLMEHLCASEQAESKLRFLNLVKNCANRLLDLVVNIMEMASMVSKDPSGKAKRQQKLSRDPVELVRIVDEITMLVRNSTDKAGKPLIKKDVELINEVSELPIIEADAHKCTQVFYNIVTNACKFTKDGKIVISSRVDPDGKWVEVAVTDTGSGIAPASLERIFEPFEQEDNSNVRGYQGIGLGLAIAHEVVQRHGGHITVESELGVGTTFTVRLPAAMCEASLGSGDDEGSASFPASSTTPNPQDEVEASTADDVLPEVVPTAKPLLLSVDDDAVNQQVIQSALSDEYEVHEAMDGEQALDYLKNCHELPSAILLDIMMPGMSGHEVCRHVRQKMHIPPTKLPILMLSASNLSSSMIEALDSGSNGFVSKPFHKQVLRAHVRAAMNITKQIETEVESAWKADRKDFKSGSSDGDRGGSMRRRRV